MNLLTEKKQEKEEPRSVLEEIIREGARKLLQAAIENEVAEYLSLFSDIKDEKGRRTVVRQHHCTSQKAVRRGITAQIIPVGNATIFASRIPNAELAILKNAGHMLIEAADDADRITLDFLRKYRKEYLRDRLPPGVEF